MEDEITYIEHGNTVFLNFSDIADDIDDRLIHDNYITKSNELFQAIDSCINEHVGKDLVAIATNQDEYKPIRRALVKRGFKLIMKKRNKNSGNLLYLMIKIGSGNNASAVTAISYNGTMYSNIVNNLRQWCSCCGMIIIFPDTAIPSFKGRLKALKIRDRDYFDDVSKRAIKFIHKNVPLDDLGSYTTIPLNADFVILKSFKLNKPASKV